MSTLLAQFRSLLNIGPVDVVSFLSCNSDSTFDEQLQVVRHDLFHRWKTNNPKTAEEYLDALPELAKMPNAVLSLAVAEYSARCDYSYRPDIEEFVSRFPGIDQPLREAISNAGTSSLQTRKFEPDVQNELLLQDRYRLIRLLGEGAFGKVFLALDVQLKRQVAIKVPKPERFEHAQDIEMYLAEAQIVASLEHPYIVPVYDMGRTSEGAVFIVSRFIEGETLESRLCTPISYNESARILMAVAEALQYAHDHRLIHRDVKPANILIETSTRTPFITDFGLAIRDDDYAKQLGLAGTVGFMSPEQARGEGHRLDGRSDIFALGVILYEMLTGERPFQGTTQNEVVRKIITVEPKPPRLIRGDVPVELERISLKALSKRLSDRYANAAAFVQDLEAWLHPSESATDEKADVPIVPRGLRSFDARDQAFFLDLLPGPRNREGLPESVAFWKQRIEETDSEQTFNIGLLYGPSGCGKSSLVKAGLLPNLSKDITAIYVEATPEDTELRISRALKKRCPDEAIGENLVSMLANIRRSKGSKVVVIIDQFEQWLYSHDLDSENELVNALLQCDGGRLQAIVMVRDDFAMAASRFMRALDVRILEGSNFATVDLFDVDHAAKVIIRFGQAFGKLPASSSSLSPEEQQFVSDVSHGLATDGKVVSIRLSLFAEMVKGKPWTPTTLQEVGGTEGIGLNFLEDTFSSSQANPSYRSHAVAARNVLKSLLPELGTNIKGHMRSQAELLEVSGYRDRPSDFNELLQILDGELRLITPTEKLNSEAGIANEATLIESDGSPIHNSYFQLTHDYLIPALRIWLTRKQRETRRGRAEIKLSERAAAWQNKNEKKQLPGWWEWLAIVFYTDQKSWSASQRKMMQQSHRLYLVRSLVSTAILTLFCLVFIAIRTSIESQQRQSATREAAAKKAEHSAHLKAIRTAYDAQINLASSAIKEGNPARAMAVLPATTWELRGWEFGHLLGKAEGTSLVLRGHQNYVEGAAITNDASRIATACLDGKVRVWNTASGAMTSQFNVVRGGATAIAWHPDGEKLAVGTNEGIVHLWSTETGKELVSPLQHNGYVTSILWNPEGSKLAASTVSGSIRIWDENYMAPISSFNTGSWVVGIDWNNEGTHFVSGSQDGLIRFWKADTSTESSNPIQVRGGLNAVAWSPDGRYILSGAKDGTTSIWDIANGNDLRSSKAHDGDIDRVAWCPDGRSYVTCSADCLAKIWDAESGLEVRSLTGHIGGIRDVRWSGDGSSVVTSSRDGTARLWSILRGDTNAVNLSGHTAAIVDADWSPSGKQVVTGSWDNSACVWDSINGQLLGKLAGHQGVLWSTCWSKTGRFIATTSADKTVGIWNADTFQKIATHSEHSGPVLDVDFSPNDDMIATGSDDCTAIIWNLAEKRIVSRLQGHDGPVWTVAFSVDGKTIATGSADSTIRIWSLDGRELALLSGHTAAINQLSWSPEGDLLVTASADGTARIWDVSTRSVINELRGSVGGLFAAEWSPDGTRIVTGGEDGSRVWDATTGAELIAVASKEKKTWVVTFSPDGTRLMVGGEKAKGEIWTSRFRNIVQSIPLPKPNSIARFSNSSDSLDVEDTDGKFHRTPILAYFPKGRPVEITSGEELVSPDGRFSAKRVSGNLVIECRSSMTVGVDPWKEESEYRAREELGWHSKKALMYEKSQNWFAAAFHWGQILNSPRQKTQELEKQIVDLDIPSQTDLEQRITANLRRNQNGFTVNKKVPIENIDPVADAAAHALVVLPDGNLVVCGFIRNSPLMNDFVGMLHLNLASKDTLMQYPLREAGESFFEAIVATAASENAEVSVYAGSREGIIYRWRPSHAGRVEKVYESPARSRITGMAVHTEKDLLAIAFQNGGIRILDLKNFQEVTQIPQEEIGSVSELAFQPAGDRLLVLSERSNKIAIVDTTSWSVAEQLLNDASLNKQKYTACSFSSDGKRLAVGTETGSIVILDSETFGEPTSLAGHARGIQELAFQRNGRLLASAGVDGTVCFFDIVTGDLLATAKVVEGEGFIESLSFSPDGTQVYLCGCRIKNVIKVKLPESALVAMGLPSAPSTPVTESSNLSAANATQAKAIGYALERFRRFEDAIEAFTRAEVWSAPDERPSIAILRGYAMVRSNDISAGLSVVDQAILDRPNDKSCLYDAACAYSIASSMDPNQVDEFAQRALSLLQAAVASGYRDVSHIEQDEDLLPISNRQEFNQILSEMRPTRDELFGSERK